VAENHDKLRNGLRDELESVGAMVFIVHGHLMQAPGWPDLQVYHPKWTGHIEVKTEEDPCRARQIYVIDRLLRRDTNAVVVRRQGPSLVALEGVLEADEGVSIVVGELAWKGNARGLLLWLEKGSNELLKRRGRKVKGQ